MYKIASLFLLGVLSFFLSGCGLAQLNAIPGDSLADVKLKMDVANTLLPFAFAGCSEPLGFNNIVNARVVTSPSPTGAWQEIWSIKACGKVKDYNIWFNSDGQGGTYFQARQVLSHS